MTLTSNRFTRDTPFFSSFTPITLLNDEQIVTSINDMVSYSIQPSNTTTVINQPYGAGNFYNFILSIKNITKNINLQINLSSKELLFTTGGFKNFVLLPNQLREISIAIDEKKFNSLIAATPIEELVSLEVRNIESNTYAIKNLSAELFTREVLPNEINIE